METRDQIVARLIAEGTVNQKFCQDLAEEFDVKEKSVIAMAVRNPDVTYKSKERLSKSGEAIVSKAQLVTQIAEKLGLEADELDTLDKARKDVLQTVLAAL